jgi:hypothetical protein
VPPFPLTLGPSLAVLTRLTFPPLHPSFLQPEPPRWQPNDVVLVYPFETPDEREREKEREKERGDGSPDPSASAAPNPAAPAGGGGGDGGGGNGQALKDTVTVTGADLATLRQGELLNDTVMDFYIKYVAREVLREPADRARCHFFSSFFWKRLSQVREARADRHTCTRRAAARRVSKHAMHSLFAPNHDVIQGIIQAIIACAVTLQFLKCLLTDALSNHVNIYLNI